MTALAINPRLDVAAFRRRMDKRSRAHISEFLLPDSAEQICTALERETKWNLVTTLAGKPVDLDAAAMAAAQAEERGKFMAHVHQPARLGGFQYLYENVPIFDAWRQGSTKRAPFYNEVCEFLNSAPVIAFARAVSGAEDIGFADAQATRYGPGCFLTAHDDSIEAKDRRAAYVVNLTRQWSPDWGGLTLFLTDDLHVEEAFTPRFNALNIFRVPQPHAVSVVAPFAAGWRYAITGWFRAGTIKD